MLAGEENEEILGGVGRMLISGGRQGVGFGLLLSFTTCPQHGAGDACDRSGGYGDSLH